MITSTHAPGWAIGLTGHIIDLTAWALVLALPFDPWVERVEHDGREPEFVLRSSLFEHANNASEVLSIGRRLVERLNGAMLAGQTEEPVKNGGVVRFRPDGETDQTIFVEGIARGRAGAFAVATVTVIGADGKPLPPPPPKASAAQTWAMAAETDELVADLLMHHGRSDGDWYEIFKTLEVAKALGKRHGGYDRLLGLQAARVELMRRTANTYRHARPGLSGDPPSDPMTVSDAKSLLSWVVRVVLAVATPPE